MDVADLSAMAAVFPGVSSERRHESLRDFLKGRHGVFLRGAEAEEDELDRFLWGRQLNCVKVVR